MGTQRSIARLALLAAVLVAAMGLSLTVGAAHPSFARAWSDPAGYDRALLGARLCRVLLGAIAGGALAAVGAGFQGLFRNPLGDPYALGVSGGAALGATIAVLAGFGLALVPAAAFVGAVGSTAVVLLTARASGRLGAEGLLLAGMVSNAVTNAGLALLRSSVQNARTQETLTILLGTIAEEPASRVARVGVTAGIGVLVLWGHAKALNLLALGDDGATALGLSVRRAERAVFLASSLAVASVVSVCGLIPFVGLIVPNYARSWVGGDHRVLIPACALGGATLLVLADAVARGLFTVMHTEPPVGAITALVGGPFFLLLLKRARVEG